MITLDKGDVDITNNSTRTSIIPGIFIVALIALPDWWLGTVIPVVEVQSSGYY